MPESILDFEKRPLRYNAIDGVDEMLVGFLFIASPLIMHVTNVAPEGSLWHWKPTFPIAEALLLVAFFVGRRLLKERITYRRTGYVRYRYSKVRGAVGAIVGVAVAGAVTYAMYQWRPTHRDRDLLVLNSLLWAGFYSYFYVYRTEMYHAYRFAITLLIAVGPLAVYSGFPDVRDISTLSGAVLGACFLVSGVIAFWSYLRNTKAANVPSDAETK